MTDTWDELIDEVIAEYRHGCNNARSALRAAIAELEGMVSGYESMMKSETFEHLSEDQLIFIIHSMQDNLAATVHKNATLTAQLAEAEALDLSAVTAERDRANDLLQEIESWCRYQTAVNAGYVDGLLYERRALIEKEQHAI